MTASKQTSKRCPILFIHGLLSISTRHTRSHNPTSHMTITCHHYHRYAASGDTVATSQSFSHPQQEQGQGLNQGLGQQGEDQGQGDGLDDYVLSARCIEAKEKTTSSVSGATGRPYLDITPMVVSILPLSPYYSVYYYSFLLTLLICLCPCIVFVDVC